MDSLTPFFDPRGVVVIGVSKDPTKLGYGLARNLLQSGYGGAVHFVNPKADTLLGHRVYPDVTSVPDPVDLAVLLIPAALVPDSLEECARRGIKAAIIATGGFRESGEEGAKLERRCLEIARRSGMRLVGPNCIGLMDTHLPLDTTFLQPPMPAAGEVAFISHSGAICAAVIDWIRGQGIGLSNLISLGNQVDVSETDMLEPVAANPHTRVITLYMEGVSDGRRFVEAAGRVTHIKPVLALKVGRYEAGRRAAASHTGALAGQEAAFDAAFMKAGVIRAGTSEELFHWARALAWCPLPVGPRVAVLTNAGGPGVTAADALELNGLKLAELSDATQKALQAILPAAASVHNPVDMLASAMPEHYGGCLRILLDDPGVDMAMVISPPPPASSTGAVVRAVIPIIQVTNKPVVMALMGDRLIQEGVAFCSAARVVEYRFPEWAASALGVLWRRAQFLAKEQGGKTTPPTLNVAEASRLLQSAAAGLFLPSDTAQALLESAGIATSRMHLAHSAGEAAQAASRVGYPVVLKINSPDLPHKSDAGGVLLGLADAEAVRTGFEQILQNVSRARPDARLDGVHVQRMVPDGQDVIVGVVRDPQFGPLVMFGSGGVEVEGLKDVAFALAPLTTAEAEYMLESTWAGRKLKGYRNLVPADRAAVIESLVRLAALAESQPGIAEMEINPLRVLPAGQGAVAVDVRVKIESK